MTETLTLNQSTNKNPISSTPKENPTITRENDERERGNRELKDVIYKLETEISLLKTENEELKEKAFRDSLTGLYNRAFAEEELNRQFLSQKPRQNLLIALIDINNFKIINDLWSHKAGDDFLKKIGESLNFVTKRKSTDIASRWGGDEFLLIFPGCSEDQKETIKERIKNAGKQNQIELAVGFATIKANEDNPYKDVSQFITAAEDKMKEDKLKEDSRHKLSQ